VVIWPVTFFKNKKQSDYSNGWIQVIYIYIFKPVAGEYKGVERTTRTHSAGSLPRKIGNKKQEEARIRKEEWGVYFV